MAAAEIIGAIGSAMGGAAAAGSALGGIGSGIKSKKKMKYAANLQYEFGEKAAENAYRRQLALLNKTYEQESYQNRVKQMREAGLSVGLMYGQGAQGGGAGSTSGAPAGATNPSIDAGQGVEQAAMGNITRGGLALVEASQNVARLRNIESNTDLNRATAEKAEAEAEAARANAGLATEKKITEMQSRGRILEKLDAEIHELGTRGDLQKAQKHLAEVDARIGEIKENIMRLTEQDQINKIHWEAEKMREDYQLAVQEVWGSKLDNWLKEKTYDIVRKQYKYELMTMGAKYVQEYWKAYVDQEKVKIFEQYGAEKAFQEVYSMWLDNQLKGPQAVIDMWYKQNELELKKMGLNLEQRKMFVEAMTSALSTLGGGLLLGRGMRGPTAPQQPEKTLYEPVSFKGPDGTIWRK